MPLRLNPVIFFAAAVAAVGIGGLAAAGLRDHAAAKAGASSASGAAADGRAAYRASTDTLLSPMAWDVVPGPVVAWLAAHAGSPATTVVQADGDSWAALTSGAQPQAPRLVPLLVSAGAQGVPVVDVALGRGPAGAPDTASLTVALPEHAKAVTIALHVVTSAQGVRLGQVPAGACPARPTAAAAARACAPTLGLAHATWSAAPDGAMATLGGQRFGVVTQAVHGGTAAARVVWEGAG